jgi:GT2 family glycosyltransferase
VSPDVSAIVVSFNAKQPLLSCLRALHAQPERLLEVLVVDNASADGSAAAVQLAFPSATVIENPTNEGFARANNRGLRQAKGRYVLFLNPDADMGAGALVTLARHLDDHPRVAAVGPRTRNPDGSSQVSFGPRLTPIDEWRQRRLVRGVKRGDPRARAEAERLASSEASPDWISASCLLARAEALRAVSGFDEAFFLYEEDVDLCVRLRCAGWEISFTPAAEVVHRLGASMAAADSLARVEYQKSHLRYYKKHNGALQTAALRGLLAATALSRLLLALLAGSAAEARVQRQILRLALALGGRP